jgi:malonyl-ACP O-methyltransferase BioC
VTSSVGELFGSRALEYDRYAKIQHMVASDLAEMITERCSFFHGDRVLDLGCGTGDLTACLMQRYGDLVFFGCDASEDMLKTARSKIPEINPLRADFNSRNFLHGSKFDLVMSSFALQWSSNPAELAGYLAGSLNSGGFLALAVPVEGSLAELKESFAELGYSGFINDFPPENFCSEILERSFSMFHTECRSYSLVYPSCRDILRSITKIGAAGRFSSVINSDRNASQIDEKNSSDNNAESLKLTAGIVRGLSHVYEKYSVSGGGYRITYRILFITAGTRQ